MRESLSILIPGSPPAELGKTRTHHWARRRAWDNAYELALLLWQDAVNVALLRHARGLYVLPWSMVDITITQFWCGTPLDRGNLIARCEAHTDAAQVEGGSRRWPKRGAGIIQHDGPDVVLSLTTAYERVAHRQDAAVRITITRRLTSAAAEIRGLVPDFTGELSTEEYLRELRGN